MNKFLELLKKVGIDLGDKEEEIKKGLEELEKSDPPSSASSVNKRPPETDSEKDKTILALTQQVAELTELVGEMKKDRDASVAAQKEKLEQEKAEKIEKLKKQGIESGKITEANWESKYKALAEKDVEAFETILEDLAVDPHFKSKEKNKGEGEFGSDYIGPLKGADSTILESITKMNQ